MDTFYTTRRDICSLWNCECGAIKFGWVTTSFSDRMEFRMAFEIAFCSFWL